MGRSASKRPINTIKVREKLTQRREPYWQFIEEGRALGFRRGARGGTWIARYYDPTEGKRSIRALGEADGYESKTADGDGVLTHGQALKAARDWFNELDQERHAGVKNGPYSVKNALDDYIGQLKENDAPAAKSVESSIRVNIEPVLGAIELRSLTRAQVKRWLIDLANSAPNVRGAANKSARAGKLTLGKDAKRKRRNTANKMLRILKAALNAAHAERQRVATTAAWATVQPLERADAERPSPIPLDDIPRLVNACSPEFRPMVQAALFTGLRYSEISNLEARDYNAESGSLHVRISKSDEPRNVWITDEAQQFFAQATAGKGPTDLIFTKANGGPWKRSHQQRPLMDACARAKLPQTSFHKLRHTYASLLAMKGVPMAMIAKQLGHSDSRLTERTYAGIAEDYVAREVRKAMPKLGISKAGNVVAINRRA